jgi:hypothetical protein
MTPSPDRPSGAGLPTGGAGMGGDVDGCGASGRSSGLVGCCAESSGRPSKRVASRRAPLRTHLVIDFYRTPRPLRVVSGKAGEAKRPHYGLDANRPITNKQQIPAIGASSNQFFNGNRPALILVA